MKKILLTSVAALMMGVASAGAAETCTSCGQDWKIFFGVGAGMQGFNYDSAFNFVTDNIGAIASLGGGGGSLTKLNNIKFPKSDTVYGMEVGMRFGKYKSIWNGGFTLSADKTASKKPDIDFEPGFWGSIAGVFVKDLKVSMNTYAATFDNYIRLNKSMENRLDLVVGVGVAEMETSLKLLGVGLSMEAHAAVLKGGLELQLTDAISMTLGTRYYLPVASEYFDSSYMVKGGFKFSF